MCINFIFFFFSLKGSALNTYYNDINVLDISTNQWLQTFAPADENSSSGLSAGIIAGVTIASIVLLVIILFLLWKFQGYIRWFFKRLHRDIWKPRYVTFFLKKKEKKSIINFFLRVFLVLVNLFGQKLHVLFFKSSCYSCFLSFLRLYFAKLLRVRMLPKLLKKLQQTFKCQVM